MLDIYFQYTPELEKKVELKDECTHKEVIYSMDYSHIECKFCNKFMTKYLWIKKFPNGTIDKKYWKNNPDTPGIIAVARPS